jgi:hypothetical protein
VGLKLNRTHQFLVYADDILLGDKINTVKIRTESLTDTSKEVGLEVNTEETKHTLMSRRQNGVTNPNLIHKEIKSTLNSCNAITI